MIFSTARRVAPLFISFVVLALGTLNGGSATAGRLTIEVSVLDAESFETRMPVGKVIMVLDGPGGVRRVELDGARFQEDLAEGRYAVTAWEADSRAASAHTVQLGSGGASAALLLTQAQEDLIPDPDELEARLAGVAAVPALPPVGGRSAAGDRAPAASVQKPQGGPAGPAASENPAALAGAFRIRRAFLPGQPFVVELPGQPSAPGDLIVIRDEEPGWLQSEERGAADVVTLFAPETPGIYNVEYLAAPELEPAATLTIEVR